MTRTRPLILVCDDEPQIVRALKVILREAGFDTLVAETAEEALDRAATTPPDTAGRDKAPKPLQLNATQEKPKKQPTPAAAKTPAKKAVTVDDLINDH